MIQETTLKVHRATLESAVEHITIQHLLSCKACAQNAKNAEGRDVWLSVLAIYDDIVEKQPHIVGVAFDK